MILGYNTNGLAYHDLIDSIELLAEIGYRGVAITLDHRALNPYDQQIDSQLEQVTEVLRQHELRCVIETGARFMLDSRTKHEPTLVTAEPAHRSRRVDFLCRAVDIAARLQADCVSLWSGIVRDGAGKREAFSRLVDGLTCVLKPAGRHNMLLAFEPEPGMFIDRLDRYGDLLEELSANRIDTHFLRLTMDIGHVHCQKELPIAEKIFAWRERLANVHIEDMRAGVHEHLMFGDGEINFPPVIAALAKIGYAGPLNVELSRHSHDGPAAARQAYNFLRPLVAANQHGADNTLAGSPVNVNQNTT